MQLNPTKIFVKQLLHFNFEKQNGNLNYGGCSGRELKQILIK